MPLGVVLVVWIQHAELVDVDVRDRLACGGELFEKAPSGYGLACRHSPADPEHAKLMWVHPEDRTSSVAAVPTISCADSQLPLGSSGTCHLACEPPGGRVTLEREVADDVGEVVRSLPVLDGVAG